MNQYVVEKLHAEDYDELLALFNRVYTVPNGRNFSTELPKMWRRTDEAMNKHLAIRVDGKIAATVGVYPLPMIIAGQKLLFATVGNVGTLPEYRNRGFMKALMSAAMTELETLDADASRLGGDRQRYNRYGYETAGTIYRYILTQENVRNYYDGTITTERAPSTKFRFHSVERSDIAALKHMKNFQQQGSIYLLRGNDLDCYDTASSWGMQPYLAEDEHGKIVGYLSASADGSVIGEQFTTAPGTLYPMLLNWLKTTNVSEIKLLTSPQDIILNRALNQLCGECKTEHASNFKILHWEKVVDALLKLKATLTSLPEGFVNLGIEDYGTLHIESSACTLTNETADLTLDKLTATRFLFGPQPAEQYCHLPETIRRYCSALFPLPLGWNGQERV